MSTDVNLLGKGLMRLGIVIILFIASPIIITMGFKGLDKFGEAPKIYMAYALISVGTILLIYTIYFAIKTFGILQKGIFNKK